MPSRITLRAGYALMIVLLLFTAVEAYRIQSNASQQGLQIYRRYAREGDTLYRMRRVLFLGAIAVRDFLLDPRSGANPQFRVELESLKNDAATVLQELERSHASSSFTRLRANLQEFWQTLEQTRDWDRDARTVRGFDFVQHEVVPRRNAAGALVRELAEANQDALRRTEAEFAQSQRSASRRLLLMVTLCLVFGLAVAYSSVRYSENLERERSRHYQEVERAHRQLQQLSARVLEVQEDERRRLSRDLHDEIGQKLTALRLEMSHLQTLTNGRCPESQGRWERARALAEETVRTVRNIALLLRPAMLDDLGLGPALQWQAEQFTLRTGIPCDFTEEGLREELPDASKTCVYRVVQEALHNSERHAAASRISVTIRRTPHSFRLKIEDDGRGFDPQITTSRSTGLGILGMQERAALLGGSLTVDSAPGQGTRLRLDLPLSEQVAAPA